MAALQRHRRPVRHDRRCHERELHTVAADRNLRLRARVTATRSGTSNTVLTPDVGPVS